VTVTHGGKRLLIRARAALSNVRLTAAKETSR
jgi:hypothetical protein